MLLRNESRVKHSIIIKLVFDDNLTRELEIQEEEFVQVSYRKNGCMKSGVGVIKQIKPYLLTKEWSCKKQSAVITVDMSTDLECHVDSFDMQDIIDIRKLSPTDVYCCCCCNSNIIQEKPNKPNIPISPEGCPITYKGVRIGD